MPLPIGRALTAHEQTVPAEMLRAFHRVGRSFNDRARWFASFLNADLSGLTLEEAERWGYELLAFTMGDPGDAQLDRAWHTLTPTPFAIARPASERYERRMRPEVRREVQETWAALREHVSHLLDDRGGAMRKLYQGDVALDVRRYPDKSIRFVIVGSARVTFLAAVGEMLEDLGPRLRRCDTEGGCRNIVAAVGHYRYCSPEHAARRRMRDYLAKPKPAPDSPPPSAPPPELAAKPA